MFLLQFVILDPPLLPVVAVVSVVNLTVNNFNLTMKCLPDNNHSRYTYEWIKKNDVLPSSTQGINSPCLTIVNLRSKDSGDYQCMVSNQTGKISSNFSTVNITGKMHGYSYYYTIESLIHCSVFTNDYKATR